jgi:hypothetical protein
MYPSVPNIQSQEIYHLETNSGKFGAEEIGHNVVSLLQLPVAITERHHTLKKVIIGVWRSNN